MRDDRAGRRRYAAHMERVSAEVVGEQGGKSLGKGWKELRRGWYLGSEAFRDRLQGVVDGVMKSGRRKSFSGEAAKAHDAVAAELLVTGGLKALGLAGQNLSELRKLDVRKQVVAWWVRQQAMVSNRWLSERLALGDEGNVSKAIKAVDETQIQTVRRWKMLVTTIAELPDSGD